MREKTKKHRQPAEDSRAIEKGQFMVRPSFRTRAALHGAS